MVKVSIEEIMRASPGFPDVDPNKSVETAMKKETALESSPKQKNTVLTRGTYKLVNCDDFLREAHKNGYLKRFADYQKHVKDPYDNYMKIAYEWSPHVVIALWA